MSASQNPLSRNLYPDVSDTRYYAPTTADLASIPGVLKARAQWVLWKASDRLDPHGVVVGLNKIPYTVHPDQKADTTNPHTWDTFERCVAALPLVLEEWALDDPAAFRGGGVGFVFIAGDPYTAFDLDHCITPSGVIEPWAQEIVTALASFTEMSVSGTGLHTIVEGKLPPGRCQDGALQMWDHDRFFAITGWHVPGTPTTIEPRQGQLEALWCDHFGANIGDTVHCLDESGVISNPTPWIITGITPAPDGTPFAQFAESQTGWRLSRCEIVPPALASGQTVSPPISDAEIVQRATAAADGAKFTRLFVDGNWSAYGSQSEADMGLSMIFTFWTQDFAQIERLFGQSALGARDKWTKRGDYRQRTITKALATVTNHYQPPTAVALDAGALAQRLCDDLSALAPADRSPEALLQAVPALSVLSPEQWSLWKVRWKSLLGKAINLTSLHAAWVAARAHAKQVRRDARREADPRPTIRVDTEISRYTDAGQNALLQLPAAPLYQRARRLVVITRGGPAPRWLRRSPDMATIGALAPAYLRELAGQAARWLVLKGDEDVDISPPHIFVETLLGRPAWPFPGLEGVIHAPTLRPDGSVLDQPGYDPDTGLFYDPGQTLFPSIPARPDMFDVYQALVALKDAVWDFPFPHNHDRSAALAACLTMACRFAIQGCVPLFAVTAPAAGSGKGYLVDALSIIGTGYAATRWPQVADPDEERKRILTVAMAGDPAIHIDNVVYPLGSPALDMAITAATFSDRVLGQTASAEAPLNMVWLASGNNLQYKTDTARRVLPITIDPIMEHPEERTGFRHDPFLPWVKHESPRLTIAALTIMKAFYVAGCPTQGLSPWGSFEAWSDLVRQALVWAGEADPCEGRKDLAATNSPEYEVHNAVLQAWHACYKSKVVTLREVLGDIHQRRQAIGPASLHTTWDHLFEALGTCDHRFDGKTLDARRIGYALRGWKGRLVNGLRLVVGTEAHTKVATWKAEGTPVTP